MKFLLLFFLLISCSGKEEFYLKIKFPKICNQLKCESEIIFIRNEEIFFSKKIIYNSKETFDFPKNEEVKNSLVFLKIYINGQFRFFARGVLDRHKVLVPAPLNESMLIGNLTRSRWAHSQILHPSGKIVITGGYKNIRNYDGIYTEKDYEKKIEIFNIYTHEFEDFPYELTSGKAFHRSYLMPDDKILLIQEKAMGRPEIIDLKNKKIEEVKVNAESLSYLGGSKIYYETNNRGYVWDIIKKRVVSEKINLEIKGRTLIVDKDKLVLIGKNPAIYSSDYNNSYILKQDLDIELENSSFSYEVLDKNIFFIDSFKRPGFIYRVNPDSFLIDEIPLLLSDNLPGKSISIVGEKIVLTGPFFEIIDPSTNEYMKFGLKQRRSYHAVSEIDENLFLLTGGISEEKTISSKMEIFLFSGGDL